MKAYASRTGTRRNLDALREAGWGLLVSATGAHRTEGWEDYGIDSGAWTAHQQGTPFDEDAYRECVRKLGPRARWVVLPDIVCGGVDSLRLSMRWLGWVRNHTGPRTAILVPVQDGMVPRDLDWILSPITGIFVGGSTEDPRGTNWKETTLVEWWGPMARARGCYLHVGRVNSARRIHLCRDAGADSFDGTSATVFSRTLPRLDAAVKQGHLWSDDA